MSDLDRVTRMLDAIKNSFFRLTESDRRTVARAGGLRPRVERLESRCMLSIAPVAALNLWDVAQHQPDTTIETPIAAPNEQATEGQATFPNHRFSFFDSIGERWLPPPPWGLGSDVAIVPQIPGGSLNVPGSGFGEGGFIEFSAPTKGNLLDTYLDNSGKFESQGVQEMLSTLKYQSQQQGYDAAMQFGGGIAGAALNSLDHSQSNATSPPAAAGAARSLPNGFNGEFSGPPAHHALETTETPTSKATANSDNLATEQTGDNIVHEGGMVTLVRDEVIDESAETTADAELKGLLNAPSRMESAYGKFQAFEISTAEELDVIERTVSDDAVQEVSTSDAVEVSRKLSPLQLTAAIDYLFAMSDPGDYLPREGHGSEGASAEESVLPEARAAKTDAHDGKTHDETRTASAAFTSSPLGSAAAVTLFAAAAGVTIRPRRRSQEDRRAG